MISVDNNIHFNQVLLVNFVLCTAQDILIKKTLLWCENSYVVFVLLF